MRKIYFLIALAFFAACANNENFDFIERAPTQIPNIPVMETPSLEPESTPFPFSDLGGITIRVAGFRNFQDSPEFTNDLAQIAFSELGADFEAEFVFSDIYRAEVIAGSIIPEALMISIEAGDPIAHIIGDMNHEWFRFLARRDALVEMGDFARRNFPSSYFEGVAEVNGGVFGFASAPLFATDILAFNKTLILEAGLPTPQDMFIAGRWSLEDFSQYLASLKSAFPDNTPLGIHASVWRRLTVFANGGYIVNPRTYFPGIWEESALEPMRALQNIHANELYLRPGFLTRDAGSPLPNGHWSWGAAFIGGTNTELFFGQKTLIASLTPWEFREIKDLDFEVGIVPPPWGSNVNFPATGWRDLLETEVYNSVANRAALNVIIKGAPPEITPEIFTNIVFNVRSQEAQILLNARDGVILIPGAEFLPTELDQEIWERYARNPIWDGFETAGFPPSFSGAWVNGLALGTDLRAEFLALAPEILSAQLEYGSLLLENIPENFRNFEN